MKLDKIEVVTRYLVRFTPGETKILLAHPKWQGLVSTKAAEHNGSRKYGCATLTKRQINDACDVLGYNGREWFAANVA